MKIFPVNGSSHLNAFSAVLVKKSRDEGNLNYENPADI